MKKLIICFTLFVFSFCVLNTFSILTPKVFAYSGDSQIVMEVNSKRVLHEKDGYSTKYMASTTKILTALVVIENCDVIFASPTMYDSENNVFWFNFTNYSNQLTQLIGVDDNGEIVYYTGS